MQTFFITANDTDAGKTYVTSRFASYFAELGKRVQVIKPLDCGGSGDAQTAQDYADNSLVTGHTLIRLPAPMAPLAEPNQNIETVSISAILSKLAELPDTDIRLIEGAGGIAVPIESNGQDWRDFAEALQPDGIIAVIDDRLGAINQSNLVHAYLNDFEVGYILSEVQTVDPLIHQSNIDAFAAKGLRLLGCLAHRADTLIWNDSGFFDTRKPIGSSSQTELQASLERRREQNTFRELRIRSSDTVTLNLADNDYLGLSQHPDVIAAAQSAASTWGTSASASPLITGFTQAHADLEATLSDWYGGKPALIWNSGYAANQAVLKLFIQSGDLILADRLIHNSLISGILQSGARLVRFQHNDLEHLESLLKKYACADRKIHLVTESVYSMDGDYPDLKKIADLKAKYDFQWFLDEAHAVGWFGPTGAGLAEATGVIDSVDILTGTLGKALASSGAYTIFRDTWMRDYCINEGGEFIYSTYLPPSSAAAAEAAIRITKQTPTRRGQSHAQAFRNSLHTLGYETLGTDSPIVPILCGTSEAALKLAADFLEQGIRVAAIRPPTVPQGSARIRISLKSNLSDRDYERLLAPFSAASIKND
jgi:8-amino-7-oxononanoate synthase/dethiobiotin synthase